MESAVSASQPKPREDRAASFASTRGEPTGVVWLSTQARERLVFLVAAGAMIVAGGLVAAVNGASSFAHGSWLAAYLVLVGGVAQLLLGIGSLALPEAANSRGLKRAQLGMWNAGTLIVAGAVLSNLFGMVLAGSAVIVGALVCFAVGGGPVCEFGRSRVLVYRLLICLLLISVVVGGVLAQMTPGN